MTDIEPSQNMIYLSNTETRLYLMDCQMCAKVEGLDANTANLF